MKGVILAGGSGTRLRPVTFAINKQLVPVYDKPLIFYPLLTLRETGITEVLIVSHRHSLGQFIDILGSGDDLGMKISYAVQPEPKGLPHALSMAEPFCRGDKLALMLGDNIFEDNFKRAVTQFEKEKKGAMIGIYEGQDINEVKRSGVAQVKGDKIVKIVEKPKDPQSRYIVVGFYLYDERVFDFIRELKPSARGEYEITDLNNRYVKEGTMKYVEVKGQWLDAGTFDALLKAHNFIADLKKRPGKLHHFVAPLDVNPKKTAAEARYS